MLDVTHYLDTALFFAPACMENNRFTHPIDCVAMTFRVAPSAVIIPLILRMPTRQVMNITSDKGLVPLIALCKRKSALANYRRLTAIRE